MYLYIVPRTWECDGDLAVGQERRGTCVCAHVYAYMHIRVSMFGLEAAPSPAPYVLHPNTLHPKYVYACMALSPGTPVGGSLWRAAPSHVVEPWPRKAMLSPAFARVPLTCNVVGTCTAHSARISSCTECMQRGGLRMRMHGLCVCEPLVGSVRWQR